MDKTSPSPIISGISDILGIESTRTESMLEAFSSVLGENLAQGNSVFVPGFGKWFSSKEEEHLEKDIANGKVYMLPPKIKVEFLASSKTLKYASHEL